MTIKYTTTVEDLLAFNVYVWTSWNAIKRNLLLLGIVELILLIQLLLNRDAFLLVPIIAIPLMSIGITYGMRYPKRVAIIFGSIIIIFASFFYLSFKDIHEVASRLPPIALPLLIMGSWGLISQKWIKYCYSGKNYMVGLHEMIIDEKGMYTKCLESESRYSWALVQRIEQNEKYIFIFLSKISAHVIPKRDIGTKDDIDIFYKKIIELKGIKT